jgi:hypothetical protein
LDNLSYNSEFLPEVSIAVVFNEHPQYENLRSLFEKYGYGFMVPNKNMVIIDGEIFDEKFSTDVLKFIEAHEISHIILGHDGPRNDDEEMDADLGAYLLLKSINRDDSIKVLLRNFKDRHGVKFDENLLKRVKNSFSDYQ